MKANYFIKSTLTCCLCLLGFINTYAVNQYTATIINVKNNSAQDQIWVFTHAGTTTGWDNGWDGKKFLNTNVSYPQLYVQGTDENIFQIATVPDADGTEIGFIPAANSSNTTYTFTFNSNYLDLTYSKIYIYDKVTETTTDVTSNGTTYHFTASTGDSPDRFILKARSIYDTSDQENTNNDNSTPASGVTTGLNNTLSNGVSVYSSHQTIIIQNSLNESGNASLIDAVTGRVIAQTAIRSNDKTVFSESSKGIYLVKYQIGAQSYAKKVVVL